MLLDTVRSQDETDVENRINPEPVKLASSIEASKDKKADEEKSIYSQIEAAYHYPDKVTTKEYNKLFLAVKEARESSNKN